MRDNAARVELEVQIDPEADAAELDKVTSGLRRELLNLDVEAVERARTGEPPPGARAIDVAAIGTLLVAVPQAFGALASLLGAVRAWSSRDDDRKAILEIDGDRIELSGASSEQQDRLIDDWLKRHAEKDDR